MKSEKWFQKPKKFRSKCNCFIPKKPVWIQVHIQIESRNLNLFCSKNSSPNSKIN